MHKMGLIPEGLRLPLVALSPQYHGIVERAMREAGIELDEAMRSSKPLPEITASQFPWP